MMLCTLLFVAFVGCFGTSKTVFGQTNFRLVGGTSNSNGRVEVFYNGTWGTICDDAWSAENTFVVCRSMEFASGYRVQTYPGKGQIWLDDVNCLGTENSLEECNHSSWGTHNCAHIEDISVQCTRGTSSSAEGTSTEPPMNVRLVGGNERNRGRVEIFHDGRWGTICDDLWDNKDAHVICNMLGYNDGIAFSGGRYGAGTGPIWIDNTECVGNESSIDQCPRNRWGDNNCRHIEDAAVECSTLRQTERPVSSTTEQPSTTTRASGTGMSIRLIGGNSTSNGRVEILYQGSWGTVCDDQWDNSDATVICRMLGYTGGIAVSNGRFGPGTGNIWLDEVRCLGNESSIDQCEKNAWGTHNCGHAEDAGVVCTSTTEQPLTTTRAPTTEQPLTTTRASGTGLSIRLIGGNNTSNGRVEILYQGSWGTVCDDSWDNNDAYVICRMLGYTGGIAMLNGRFGPGTGNIWLDEVRCLGNESSIDQCQKDAWGTHNCGHTEDAGVICTSTTEQPLTTTRAPTTEQPLTTTRASGTDMSIRLIGGNNTSNGRVEILYQGSWGTVCDDQWDNSDATVICRMLGYTGGIAMLNGRFGPGTGNIWLDEVRCLGNESSIDQCQKDAWGTHNCGHTEDAGVVCTATTEQPLTTTRAPTTEQPLTTTRASGTGMSIRLIGGNSTSNGRVEILYQGSWGTVCDDQWDNSDATVICRMLGHTGGIAMLNGRFGPGTGNIWLDEVRCLGNESSIDQCQKDAWGTHNCGHTEDAGVVCTSTTEQPLTTTRAPTTEQPLTTTRASGTGLPIRLIGGNNSREGRVEILYQGSWGTVCDDQWDDNDAYVICRMLGYTGGIAMLNGRFGPGTGNIWLDEVRCLGNESSIDQCQKEEWGRHNCGHSEDAGVICTVSITQILTSTRGLPTIPTTQQPMTSTEVHTTHQVNRTGGHAFVRLAGSNSSSAGRVEILHLGHWGTVCDDRWDDNDARVICHMLGFSDGISTPGGSYGPGNGTIWLDEVSCSGNEQSIIECAKNSLGDTDCQHGEDAGVKCGMTSTTPSRPLLAVRLVGGNSASSGRVEVNYQNKWGTVCDDKWDDNDAHVVCRMLGYNYGIAFAGAEYGMGSGDIWLDEVNCTGSESAISDCPRNPWGVHDCNHGNDAAVQCSTNPIPVGVRLMGGQNPSSGRVELNLNGEWGTVCDDGWDNEDARVICRMLGYIHIADNIAEDLLFCRDGVGYPNSWYGPGRGKIFLDEVNCAGNETSIIGCKKNAWGSSNCNHFEDASVQCYRQEVTTVRPSLGSNVSVRLAGNNSLSSGRVEIRYNGQWGTVCDDSWDNRDANVVCRMLGYVSGTTSESFGAGTGPIWLDQTECDGNETSISQCRRNQWGIHDCTHKEDAGVQCSNNFLTTTPSNTGTRATSQQQGGDVLTTTPGNRGARGIQRARLVGGNNFSFGRLEVLIDNVWGTVCDDNWDNRDAAVACNMLGFSGGIGYRNARYGRGTGQIWLDEMNCTGEEMSLTECVSPNAGIHDCSHTEDASVQCFRNVINLS